VIPSARGFGAALTKGIAPEMAVAGKASGMSFGKAMAAGIASTALIGVGVITGLGAIGKTFHEMESTIRVGTGKSGAALDGLVASALNVGRKVPSSFADIATTVTALNVRLGLTGPTLETLSKQALIAGRITKQSLDLNSLTGSFNAFNIKGKDTTKALDDLFRISQATGTPINELANAAIRGGPAFRQFGLSFSTSAALIGVLDKAGINSGKTIMALTIGLTKFAKEGKAPGPALRSTIDQIQAFTKHGKDAAAIKLAASIFGTRGATQFVAAVKSGKVNLDDMMKSAGVGNDTILKAGPAVSTLSSKWGVFKNNVLIAVKPLADAVFKAFGDGMQFMSDTGLPALQKFGAALSEKVMPVLKKIGDFITGTAFPAIKNFVQGFADGTGTGGKFRDILQTIYDKGIVPLATFITGTALPALASIASWITDTGIPALSTFKDWVIKNRDTLKVLAEFIGVVLLPVFANMAVKAVASAVTQAGAWVSTQVAGGTSALAQLGSHYIIVGGWVMSTAKAVASAATTAVIWGMYKAEAIAGAATYVGSLLVIASGWIATAATAMASAVVMAAAWVIGLGPIAWVIAGIAALIAIVVVIATKTTWFQTIWEYMTGAIGAVWRGLWNNTLAPVFRLVMDGLGSILGGISNMFEALSHVPGFGWAHDAAVKLREGSDWAHNFANGIKDIPPDKKVKITVTAAISNAALRVMNLAPSTGMLRKATGFASGGVVPGIGYGDTQPAMLTPGEFVVRRDGSNITDALNHFGAKAAPTAGVTQYIYPTPGMSEEQVGAVSARQIEWAMRGNR